MSKKRVKILSIGGFDPSGGAGVLADIKTFEQHRLLGMAVNTANTVQTEDRFQSVNWIDKQLILEQLVMLTNQYHFEYIKVGLIPSFELIHSIHERVPTAKLIWDPVLSASAGFDMQHDLSSLHKTLEKVFFLTPNWNEVIQLSGKKDAKKGAELIAEKCNVYLKGGHNSEDLGTDFIYYDGTTFTLRPNGNNVNEKHGSGCVLSSALAANLAMGYPVKKACLRTKTYVTRFLESNNTLLGYHK